MQRPVDEPPALQSAAIEPLSLAALPAGAAARLTAIRGGRELQRKLGALGLRIGSELRVEHRRGRGLVVAAGQSRIALGGGIVDKLVVLPLTGEQAAAPAAAD